MSRLLGFYGTQMRVLWEWRGGRIALLKRLVITLSSRPSRSWRPPGSCRA